MCVKLCRFHHFVDVSSLHDFARGSTADDLQHLSVVALRVEDGTQAFPACHPAGRGVQVRRPRVRRKEPARPIRSAAQKDAVAHSPCTCRLSNVNSSQLSTLVQTATFHFNFRLYNFNLFINRELLLLILSSFLSAPLVFAFF